MDLRPQPNEKMVSAELMIAPAQAGALNFRLIVPGRPAHGALHAEGIPPFDKYLPLYRAICIGKVQSGIRA